MLGWEKRRDQLLKEFETHIENETRDNIDRGMSPTDARQAAHRKFGNVPLAVEQSREALGGLWLERLGQNIRHPPARPRRVRPLAPRPPAPLRAAGRHLSTGKHLRHPRRRPRHLLHTAR